MNRIVKTILIIVGVLLLLNAIVLAVLANYNLGILLTFLVGIISLFYGIFYDKIRALFKDRRLKWLKYTIFVGLAFMLGVILFLGVFGQIDSINGQEDAIVILGAGVQGETVTYPLMQRLDRGLACWRENPDAIIVVTGGKGAQENITEALAMERYLIKRGVPQEVIYKEERATSTYENFTYTKEILDQHFNKLYHIVFVTNDFHIYRASALAKIAGLRSGYLHAPTVWYSLPMAYLREFLAVLKLWVFGV